MADDSDASKDGGAAIDQILHYLAYETIPRHVARKMIAKGFTHNRPDGPAYEDKEVTSENQLAFALGYRSRTGLFSNNSQHARKLPDRTEDAIRRLYDFDLDTECWKHFSRQNKRNFIDAYERRHAKILTEPMPDALIMEDRPPLVPLQWDSWVEDKGNKTKIASLTLRTGNTPVAPVPGQVQLGFDLNCLEFRTDSFVTCLRECELTFDCGKGTTGDAATRAGSKERKAEYDNARFTILSTDKSKPSWKVTEIDPGGIRLVESVPPDFVTIDGLRPGDVIRAKLTGSVKDIVTTFVMRGEEKMSQSAAKQKLKKRLHDMDITGGEEGEAEFASSEIAVMAKPAVTDPQTKD